MNDLSKPTPPDNALSRPYWEAASQGRLVLQRCCECAKVRHYPRLLCDGCHSNRVEWIPASGRGRIHSWTITHHAFHPSFKAELPYALVTVDLEEGVRALGRWRGGALSVGLLVAARFDTSDGQAQLVFSPD